MSQTTVKMTCLAHMQTMSRTSTDDGCNPCKQQRNRLIDLHAFRIDNFAARPHSSRFMQSTATEVELGWGDSVQRVILQFTQLWPT